MGDSRDTNGAQIQARSEEDRDDRFVPASGRHSHALPRFVSTVGPLDQNIAGSRGRFFQKDDLAVERVARRQLVERLAQALREALDRRAS